MKKKTKPKKPTLHDMVAAAHEAGVKVTCSLEPKEMPWQSPDDHDHVKLLIAESRRVSKLGNNWLTADVPNQVAAKCALDQGWAYALAAGWLRCKLKGELLPESEMKK